MASGFTTDVYRILGPFLSAHGFVPDGVVEGEPHQEAAAYFRSRDCKFQVYYSPRNGEFNCMIALLDAPNEIGQNNRSNKWHYIPSLSKHRAGWSIDELRTLVPKTSLTREQSLTRINDLLEEQYDAARSALLMRTIYYARVTASSPRENPAGLFRRIDAEPPQEQAFRSDLRWHSTSALALERMGQVDYDYVEISPTEAHSIIEMWREKNGIRRGHS